MYYKLLNDPEKHSITKIYEIYQLDNIKNEIVILDVSNPKHSKLHQIDTLKSLPDLTSWTNLVTIKANWHKITKFPELPLQIQHVELETNSIDNIPNIDHLINLETLNMSDNNVETLSNKLPNSLRTLVLGFNKIRIVSSILPEDLGYINLEYNFISELPSHITDHNCQKSLHHNEGKYNINQVISIEHNINRNINNYYYVSRVTTWFDRLFLDNNPQFIQHDTTNPQLVQQNIPNVPNIHINRDVPTTTTYNNGQNVHNHNIQESFRKSIDKLVIKIKENNNGELPPTNNIESELYNIMYQYYRMENNKKRNTKIAENIMYKLYYWIKGPIKMNGNYKKAYDLIIKWHHENYMHAGIEYSYSELLSFVMFIIYSKPIDTQKDMINILVEETLAANNLCLTGKISRLINTLNGFEDSIEIKLNNNEIINNRLITIHKKYEDSRDITKARDEARESLKEFELSEQELTALVETIEY